VTTTNHDGRQARKGSTMDTTEVTPAHRFAAIAMQHSLPLGNLLRRAIDLARDIDGFPHSYTAEQVDAASRLLVCLDDTPEVVWSHANTMLAVGLCKPVTWGGAA